MGCAGKSSNGGCVAGCDFAAVIDVLVPTETEKMMAAFSNIATIFAPTAPAWSAKKISRAMIILKATAIHLAGSPNWLDKVAVNIVTIAPATPGVTIDLELRNSFTDSLLRKGSEAGSLRFLTEREDPEPAGPQRRRDSD